MDHPPFPVRSADEPGMEKADTPGADQYDCDRDCGFVVEEINR
jgi:hypothetical protein